MSHKRNRLVYTSQSDQTVTIDYSGTLRVFLSQKEHHSFSAELILRMLDNRMRSCRVQLTAIGRLHIAMGEVRCVLTQQAIAVLEEIYCSRHDLQSEFPLLSTLFPLREGEQAGCLAS